MKIRLKLIAIFLILLTQVAVAQQTVDPTAPAPVAANQAEKNSLIPKKMSEKLSDNNSKQRSNNAQLDSALKGSAQDQQDVQKTIKSPEKNLGKSLIIGEKVDIASLLIGSRINSMMFSDKEIQNIERAVTAFKGQGEYALEKSDDGTGIAPEAVQKAVEEVLPEQSYVYLASILYISSDSWTIWINDRKITSDKNSRDSEFYVKSIDRGKVTLLWKLGVTKWNILSGGQQSISEVKTNADNEVETEFELRPNQTFTLKSKTIVEGKSVIDAIKSKQSGGPSSTLPTNGVDELKSK